MNQKQMEYFMEVYRIGNIQGAADNLYVSRQGVSKMLRGLEEELGHLLFERSPHGLIPTDYANALLPHVGKLLDEYRSIESMNTLAAQSRHVVTVYALDHVFSYLGANFFADFHKIYPHIVLSTVDTTDDAALEGLQTGRCNFAIVTAPIDGAQFQWAKLFFSKYCARLHKYHPLASAERLRYEDLDGQTIVSKGRGYRCFRHNIDKYILLQGFHVDIIAETADENLIYELMSRYKAINIGYDYAANINPHPDIVMKELGTADDIGQDVCLVWDKTITMTNASKKFMEFMLSWLPANGIGISKKKREF